MCFWVEVNMFFVLHNYYDINNIFFVFVGLERKLFAIPQLSPMCVWGYFQTFIGTSLPKPNLEYPPLPRV